MATPKLMVCTASFFADVNGKEVIVHQGDRYPVTNVLVKRFGQWFEPVKP